MRFYLSGCASASNEVGAIYHAMLVRPSYAGASKELGAL